MYIAVSKTNHRVIGVGELLDESTSIHPVIKQTNGFFCAYPENIANVFEVDQENIPLDMDVSSYTYTHGGGFNKVLEETDNIVEEIEQNYRDRVAQEVTE